MKYLTYKFIASVALLGFVWGCAGARGSISMDASNYPVSMSAYLYDKDYKILAKDKELAVIDKFTYQKTAWGIFWNIIPLTKNDDVADAMNKKANELKADGMVNFRVTVAPCFTNNYFYWTYLDFIPLVPGCADLTIEGDFVRLSEK